MYIFIVPLVLRSFEYEYVIIIIIIMYDLVKGTIIKT